MTLDLGDHLRSNSKILARAEVIENTRRRNGIVVKLKEPAAPGRKQMNQSAPEYIGSPDGRNESPLYSATTSTNITPPEVSAKELIKLPPTRGPVDLVQ
jgi:hypothetical protein